MLLSHVLSLFFYNLEKLSPGYKVFFGYSGGHGIYNSSQETCNWGNSTGAIGAGYDGSCGTFPNDLRWGTGNATAYYNIIQGTWEIWIRW